LEPINKYSMFTVVAEHILFKPELSDEERFNKVGFWHEKIRNEKDEQLIEHLVGSFVGWEYEEE
jgi:hypothetical protein